MIFHTVSMHIQFSRELKKVWADKTFDLSVLGAAATLFGQFYSETQFSLTAVLLGICMIIVGYVISYVLYQP